MKNTGIMGGTFNPIHIGHLIAAQEAMEEFKLERIIFIPNRIPPHRQNEPGLLKGSVRFDMVNLAINSNPYFRGSRIELDREEISYTYHTIRSLKEEYPETDFSFITGVDSLLKDPWVKLDELLGLLKNFIAVTRPGFDDSLLKDRIAELDLSNGGNVKLLPVPKVGISSTMIRQRIKNGKSIKYMVPDPVESYIRKNNLYNK